MKIYKYIALRVRAAMRFCALTQDPIAFLHSEGETCLYIACLEEPPSELALLL
ncbi:hypothetical protein HanIR_Chr13g0658611 [Helianthus annuus]|nr:hypothetical protein HanIR_Chr13g0658611 [Helianthus annuus]